MLSHSVTNHPVSVENEEVLGPTRGQRDQPATGLSRDRAGLLHLAELELNRNVQLAREFTKKLRTHPTLVTQRSPNVAAPAVRL